MKKGDNNVSDDEGKSAPNDAIFTSKIFPRGFLSFVG
jgi:hypothetical protein